MCDLRALNLAVERKPQPFPDMQSIRAKIPSNTRILGKVDIKNGYHLLKVHKDSKKYLNFASPLGILRHLRTPMGLKSSNDTFVTITDEIFAEARNCTFIQAIDDFLICAVDQADLVRQFKV